MGRRRARQAPQESLCLFLALGDAEGLRRRPLRRDWPRRYGRGRHCLFHHCRRLSQRAGLREDARRPAPDLLGHFCDRLFARGPPAGRADAHLSRACSSRSASCSRRESSARMTRRRRACGFARCRRAGGRTSSRRSRRCLSTRRTGSIVLPTGARPFCRRSAGTWADFAPLARFVRSTTDSGVMPGRTWIIAPDTRDLANGDGSG